jgi:hypothetical protein
LTRLALSGIAAAATILLLSGAGHAGAGDRESTSASRFTLAHAQAFEDYPLYFAGDRVEGFPLVAVLRRADTADFVSFVYGNCTAADDLGCAPPIEIQVWPACRRHLALYRDNPSFAGSATDRRTVRGVPAAVFDDGTRLELQTGRSTVVVFAESRARLGTVAGALRSLDAPASRRGALAAPIAGALEGELDC